MTIVEFRALLLAQSTLNLKPANRLISIASAAGWSRGNPQPFNIPLLPVNLHERCDIFHETGFRRPEKEFPCVHATQRNPLSHGPARDAGPDPFPVRAHVRRTDGF